MNRGDIVRAVAVEIGEPVTHVDFVLARLLEAITGTLESGQEVNIRTFGKFEPRKRNAVVRKNPRTGEDIPVPAKVSVGFIPSVNLKARLNEPKRGRRRKASDKV